MPSALPRSPLAIAAWCVVFVACFAPAFAETEPDLPTRLPILAVTEDPLHPDDATLQPFAIGRETLTGRSVATLKDALGSAPGVLMQESFGGFEPPRISIRGSGLQSAPSSRGVQFLLENFPLTLADGSFNAALIEPQLFDRVDVFRGATAARCSPATLGGAFNLRTAPPVVPASAHLRTEAGSFGGARALLTGHANAGRSVLAGAASFARHDGYRDHSAQERSAVFAKLSRPLPKGCDTSFSVYHVRAAYDVPGPLTLAAAGQNPRSVSADVRRDQPRRESSTTQLAAQTSQQNDVLAIEAGVSWLRTEDWFRQLRANGISDSLSDDLTFRGVFTRRLTASAGEHLLRLGTTLSRGWRDLSRFQNDSAASGRLFGRDGAFATTAAVDFEGTAQLRKNLTATAGLTGLLSRRDISNRMPPGAAAASASPSLHTSALQPRVRIRWAPTRGFVLFAAVARVTEPPTFDDLIVVSGTYPNLTRRSQSLADQHATTWEIGTTGSHGPFGWDVTAYQGRWTNEILRLADAQGLPRGAVNAGPTRHAGLETAFHWQLLDRDHRLRLTTAATWSRFTFASDPLWGRNRLAGAPPLLGSAQLLYEHPRGFFSSAALDWTAGATPVDHANRMFYGGHTLTRFRAGWRQSKSWSLFVEVRNVFDRQHIASTAGVLDVARNPAATAVFLPGAGRAFALGFEWQVFAERKPRS